jgi:hypothetical protein
MSESRLVEVYRAKNSVEAHLIKAALDEAGIRARVTGDMLQGAIGDIPTGWMTSPQILVMELDAARARELIQQQEELRRTAVHDTDDDEAEGDFDESASESDDPAEQP